MGYEISFSSGVVVRTGTAREVRELLDELASLVVRALSPMAPREPAVDVRAEAPSEAPSAGELVAGAAATEGAPAKVKVKLASGKRLRLSPEDYRQLFEAMREHLPRLSPRELQIVRLLLAGKSYDEISKATGVQHVNVRVRAIQVKLEYMAANDGASGQRMCSRCGSKDHDARFHNGEKSDGSNGSGVNGSKRSSSSSSSNGRGVRAQVSLLARSSAADALVVEHHAWAEKMARCVCRKLPGVDVEEAVGEAMVGFLIAARRWDPARGNEFKGWCFRRIRGAIIDYVRGLDPAGRFQRQMEKKGIATKASERGLPVRARMDVYDLEDQGKLGGGAAPTQEIWVELDEALAKVRALPRRTAAIMERYFFGTENLRQIGERLGVTESRVCQIVQDGRFRLRQIAPANEAVDADARLDDDQLDEAA